MQLWYVFELGKVDRHGWLLHDHVPGYLGALPDVVFEWLQLDYQVEVGHRAILLLQVPVDHLHKHNIHKECVT